MKSIAGAGRRLHPSVSTKFSIFVWTDRHVYGHQAKNSKNPENGGPLRTGQKAVEALHRDLDRYEKLLGIVGELERYQESGLWKEDYEADERGELPDGLRRGVLSEDGLYDLLEDISELNARMTLSRK